ncbi:C4-dicarboxylate ABC transporter substrate-binding protein [Sagittula stellata]|uniref:TRAP-T family transporter, DctP (Periplasmic binding) subunit n=1 Tax=Sagittula stellata (strain ATCC 700073 / DSM 11524 / E-37) TaxID=388399 RepID=A3K495_SAGS3|nr:C4-dicarboxylate ABC transporter substrate-binding protein [Sagittula stellata]EBA07794.1 TRAP-T family transporter, DctP (periplasmic binding) subunit [Sagittula stellata E-37]
MRLGFRLVVSIALAAAVSPANAEEFTYGSWPASTDWLNTTALPRAFAQIEEETGGDVTWNLISGGQLAGGKETFSAIQDGLMDAGFGFAPYAPNLLPSISMLYGTVVAGEDPVVAAGAATETILLHCPSCLDEAKAIEQLPLGMFAASPYVLMCREPIASVADLKGKRIRASGSTQNMLAIAGASVVSASLADAVSLLQRGGLDCVAGAGGWMKTYGYSDFAKYVTDFSFGVTAPAIGLQLGTAAWERMTPEGRLATLRAAPIVTAEMTINNFVLDNQKTIDAEIANNGVQMVEVGDDFAKLMADYQVDEAKINADRARDLGVEDPEAIQKAYAAAVEKWRGLAPEIGTDVDAFADVLWTEVYSKLDPESL